MSAGTEGYVDTRGSSTFLEDSIGTMISKVLAAKVLADKERKFAQKKALEQGIDEAQFNSMFPRGDFFKKALVGEFGGFKLKKKKQELAALYRKALLVGKVTKNKRLRGKVVGQLKQSLIYSKANLKNAKRFRSQFDYTDYEDYLAPQSEKIPSTRKRVKNAIDGGGGKRVSREQIIESIDAIAKSIEKTAQSITQSSSSVYGTLIVSNQLQADVAQDLKVRNSTLEDKLQKLVDVISNQTQVQKDIVDKREDIQQEAQLERKTVAAGSETPDDLKTKENERKMYSSFADESDMMAAYGYGYEPPVVRPVSGMMNDLPSMEAYGYPKAEKGGMFSGKGGLELHGTEALLSPDGAAKIVSGPDSGYLHNIDEPTTVVPLDNNYTQGERSAVTGKLEPKPRTPVIPKPKLQQFEMGTQNTLNNTNNVNALTMNNDLTQSLIDAASLLPMAAGGGTLAMTNEYLSTMGSSGDDVRPLIQQNSRALSNVFGLPSTIVSKASGTGTVGKTKEEEQKKEEDTGKKKSLFEKMKEGFGKFMELLGKKINDTDPGNDPGPGGAGDGAAATSAMELIAGSEGGYNSINMGTAGDTPGGAKSVLGKDLTEMTVGEVMDAQANKGVHAAGKYQIIPSTMKEFVSKMGISRDDKFDQTTQEKFKDYVAKHARPKVGEFISGKLGEDKIDQVVMELAREFASVGVPYDTTGHNGQRIKKGQSYYSGIGGNRAGVDPDMLKQKLLADRQKFLAAKESPAPATPVAGNPPGALAPGQRPDKALSPEQHRVAVAARAEADALGLAGKDKDKFVAEKVMAVPSPIFQRPAQPSGMDQLSSAPASSNPMIVALNTPAPSQTSTAGTAPQSNAETATVGRGSNPLQGSGLYIG